MEFLITEGTDIWILEAGDEDLRKASNFQTHVISTPSHFVEHHRNRMLDNVSPWSDPAKQLLGLFTGLWDLEYIYQLSFAWAV